MLWFGLFLAVASIPGVTSAAYPTGWAVLSAFLPLVAWRSGHVSWRHAIFCLGLCYAALSIMWSTDPWTGLYRLWQLCIFGGAIWLGTTLSNPRVLYLGLGLGGCISSAVALAQWFGWHGVPSYSTDYFAGLHLNGVFAGMIAALLIIAAIQYRIWWLIPGLVPGFILAGSRGAVVALAAGLGTFVWRSWFLPILVGLGAMYYASFGASTSDAERTLIWASTLLGLDPLGHGLGSFNRLMILYKSHAAHAEHAHNDLLQLAFELGLGAIAIIAILPRRPDPILATFVVLSAFSFPLWMPIPAFIAGVAIGAGLRDGGAVDWYRPLSLSWPFMRMVPVSSSVPEQVK